MANWKTVLQYMCPVCGNMQNEPTPHCCRCSSPVTAEEKFTAVRTLDGVAPTTKTEICGKIIESSRICDYCNVMDTCQTLDCGICIDMSYGNFVGRKLSVINKNTLK